MQESQAKGIRDLEMLRGHGYEYRLLLYTPSLWELTVQAYEVYPKGHFYRIIFHGTHYMQTAIHWIQGDFELATPEKYAKLADALHLTTEERERLLLFVASPPNKPEVLVLCHAVYVSQEIPLP